MMASSRASKPDVEPTLYTFSSSPHYPSASPCSFVFSYVLIYTTFHILLWFAL